MVLIAGFGHKPAPVELACRQREYLLSLGVRFIVRVTGHCNFFAFGIGEVGFGQSGIATALCQMTSFLVLTSLKRLRGSQPPGPPLKPAQESGFVDQTREVGTLCPVYTCQCTALG